MTGSTPDPIGAIVIEQLQKSYGGVEAVKDVSLTVQPGEIFGLLGPNGAGKTTTIRCLCTLAQPDRGAIFVSGVDALKDPRSARQRLGYVAQQVAIDKMLTGRELLQLQAALHHIPRREIGDRVAAMLTLLGLTEYADQRLGTYSGGLQKRLDLAAGLLHRPDVLVLDEPTVGLDIESRTVVWQFLRDLRAQGTTVLITSHYLEEIDALADRVAILDRGRVIASGTSAELKAQVGGDRITLRLREFSTLAEAQQAQTVLESLPVVQSVLINPSQGNSLNLVVKGQSEGQNQSSPLMQVQQALQAAGLPIFGIAQARPSLDDVYLAATGQTLVDAELAAGPPVKRKAA
jgi:ABC-2 type transport system ATP-binding protein